MKKLLSLAIALCLLFPAMSASANYATSVTPSGLLRGVNQKRSTAGQRHLVINSKLAKAAQARSRDMVRRNYWSHSSPEGWRFGHFIADAGYAYTAGGENLAFGQETSSAVVADWMASSTHRGVMLDSRFREVGFATADSANYIGTGPQTVIVAMFGAPVTPAPKPKPKTQPVAVAPVQPKSEPKTPVPAQVDKTPRSVIQTQPAGSKKATAPTVELVALGLYAVLMAAFALWIIRQRRR